MSFATMSVPLTPNSWAKSATVIPSWYNTTSSSSLFVCSLVLFLYIAFRLFKYSSLLFCKLFFFNFCLRILSSTACLTLLNSIISSTASSITSSSSKEVSLSALISIKTLSSITTSSSSKKSSFVLALISNSLHFFNTSATLRLTESAYSLTVILFLLSLFYYF